MSPYSRCRRQRVLRPDGLRTPEASLRRRQAAPKDGSLLLDTHRCASWSPMSEKPDMGHPELLVRCGQPARNQVQGTGATIRLPSRVYTWHEVFQQNRIHYKATSGQPPQEPVRSSASLEENCNRERTNEYHVGPPDGKNRYPLLPPYKANTN